MLVFILVFANFEDAFAQRRNKYQRQRSKSRVVSKYRGGRTIGGSGRFRPYQYVGFGINALNYFGDLAPVNRAASTDLSFTRPGIGIQWGYKFLPAVAARATFNWGILRGDDFSADPADEVASARYTRNLSFRNNIKELTVGAEFYVFPNYRGARLRPPFNAYIFVGIGGFHHEPQGLVPDQDYQSGSGVPDQAGEWVNLRKLGTEGQFIDGVGVDEEYSPWQLLVPLGIGGVVAFPGTNFSIGIELGYRLIFTDYLDDVSTNYVSLDQFTDPTARILSDRSAEAVAAVSGETRDLSGINVETRNLGGVDYNVAVDIGAGQEGSIRGNPDNDDLYFITQIRVTYILSTRPRSTAKFR